MTKGCSLNTLVLTYFWDRNFYLKQNLLSSQSSYNCIMHPFESIHMIKTAPLSLLLLLIFPLSAMAVPATLSHQGRILTSEFEPLAGIEAMTFRFYDQSEEGSVIWEETIDVAFNDGFYTVTLGTTTTIDDVLFDSDRIYLALQVGNQEELSPRIDLTSVPFAIKARSAESVTGAVVAMGGLWIDQIQVLNAEGEWTGPALSYQNLTDLPVGYGDNEVRALLEQDGYVTESDLDHEHDIYVTTTELEAGGFATTEDIDQAILSHDHNNLYLLADTLGTSDENPPNEGSNLVHWNNLTGVPEDFADGTDDPGIYGSGVDNYLARFDGAGALESSPIYTDDTGKVGINTNTPRGALEVDGMIIVGSGAECTSETEGGIQYNPEDQRIEVCNGTEWVSIAGYDPCDEVMESCLQIRDAGCSTGNDIYTIDTDGPGNLEPMSVFCDMETNDGGWIVISHDHEEWTDDDSCENHDCKVFDIIYEISDSEIIALLDNSTEVTQTFSKRCHSSDMDCGGAQTHFTNIHGNTACPFDVLGIDFNCNNNDPTWREDHLNLTGDTGLIPLKTLWGGDSGSDTEYSNYQVGKLYIR